MRDVWFMRPDTRIPHVLFAEGTPAWTLYHRDETAEAGLGEPHERGQQCGRSACGCSDRTTRRAPATQLSANASRSPTSSWAPTA
ncbi:hypothetical protein ACFV2X_28195 [Streptomyces sp. NPDC059679]|uniref:hypothetical protein n=1 Tax=Streptomyces sp. NPDC059679 TaxID=3346903 RepID=UPI00367E1C37